MSKPMTSILPFPSHSDNLRSNASMASITSRMSTQTTRATSLEVYDIVYGNVPYENLDRLYEEGAVYENPIVTASCREVIADIYAVTRKLSNLDMPKPLAMLSTLFRIGGTAKEGEPWFQALRVWSEMEDICESESFDGHRTTIIEHHVHALFLPGLHTSTGKLSRSTNASSDSLDLYPSVSNLAMYNLPQTTSQPTLPIPGIALALPTPFHLKLRVITRLSFNEQGRITQHRDIWDVKDVFGLLPGGAITQWIGARLFARGLTVAAHLGARVFGSVSRGDVEEGQGSYHTPGGSSLHTGSSSFNSVRGVGSVPQVDQEFAPGITLQLSRPTGRHDQQRGARAPDVDRDG